MRVRAKQNWLAWLLPLLVLRAFLPVGFMLSWAGGELQVMVCSGIGPAPMVAAVSPQGDVHEGEHSHHAADEGQSEAELNHAHQGASTHKGSYCPFAVAGTATLSTISLALALDPPSAQTFDSVSQVELRSASVLIDRIRGPPRV